MRAFTILLGMFVAGTVAEAQAPARDQPPKTRAGTGVIRGRVVRADTGEPLRRVLVRVDEWSTGDHSVPGATMTDAEGRYELTELPAGRYQLKASRGGYVEVAYGQRRPFERGRPLELAEGAVLRNIDFALPPGGVVTGRIVDEVGEPVAHVYVTLERRRYVDGARRSVAERGSSTDDRGEFRIFGVPPGDYSIVARLDPPDFGSKDRVRYVPTYYPGTPIASEAQRLTVGTGQELPGIMIALERAATATVRGVVSASRQGSGPFTIVTAREISAPQASGQTSVAVVAPDGSFAIGGLLPGSYFLEARSVSGSAFASKEVVVAGSDLAGIALSLSNGAKATGRIRFDTGKPPQGLRASQVFVMPTFMDPFVDHQMVGAPPAAHDDWSFEVQGLRGRGFIRAGTMGDWQMKRVLREGADVTDTPLDFDKDVDGLEIELTQSLTTVAGTVSDDRGDMVLDAVIVVFAEDRGKWGLHSRFIESARPDQRGRFTIKGLPPGRYLAIAVGSLEPGEERDSDLLEGWLQGATHFTLSEGETHGLDLKLSAF